MPYELSDRDRAALERHHAGQHPTLFVDNFPWADPAFTRRFTVMTDVKHQYWGPATADVDRIESVLSAGTSSRPHVIDLCCGAGRHVLELAARGIRATGIDVSPFAIRRARSRAAARRSIRRGDARLICSDVLSPPDTGSADLIAMLCEQIVNFSPAQAEELVALWRQRVVPGGALVIEAPAELPPAAEELYWMEEPLFLDVPCWVRYTQTPDPKQRTLLERFSCLPEPGAEPRSFFNSRKYYTPDEIAGLAPTADVQVIEIPNSASRTDLIWVVLRC
jgi:SAM-dependent methyltransferase